MAKDETTIDRDGKPTVTASIEGKGRTVRFEVLGPVRVVDTSGGVPTLSEQRRTLLAVLIARANRDASTDLLTEALWGDRPPTRPDKSLQMHILRLRRALGRPDRLQGVPGGYRLRTESGEVDADVFIERCRRARAAAADSDLDSAVEELRRALDLWRGGAYAGVDEPTVVAVEARRLAEARLNAIEELYETELKRGSARDIVPELITLVGTYPLRERLTGHLMLALSRAGRSARALATYRTLCRRLGTELDARPGRALRDLAAAIEAEDTTGPSAAGSIGGAAGPDGAGEAVESVERLAAAPDQLPPMTGGFVGRHAEIDELQGALDNGRSPLLITGTAGVGKTALAVTFAHRISERFGDGRLYLDLRGYANAPAVDPPEALTRLLRGLGVDPSDVPNELEDAIAHYRSTLSGRRVLIVLDNAATAAQIRPLLPPTPGSVALVTSRNRLSGLVASDGARRMKVAALGVDQARELLTQVIGGERVDTEPAAVTTLIEACAGLPLALRIAAAHLVDQPERSIAAYAAELGTHPLDVLQIEDDEPMAVAAALDLSYRALDEELARLFRLLGLVPGPDFTVDAASALSGRERGVVRLNLDRLLAAHLVERPVSDRFRFHDLLREYAKRRAEADELQPGRDDALRRLFAWYYLGKEAAMPEDRSDHPSGPLPGLDIPAGLSGPTFADTSEAFAWLRAERANLVAAILHAARHGPAPWTWHLAMRQGETLADDGHSREARQILQAAADAADRSGADLAAATCRAHLAVVVARTDLALAATQMDDALTRAEACDDLALQALCLNNLGVIHSDLGEIGAAVSSLSRAQEIFGQMPNRENARMTVLSNLGTLVANDDLRKAADTFAQALALHAGDPSTPFAQALYGLHGMRARLGELSGVDAQLQVVAELATRLNRPFIELRVQIRRAELLVDAGDYHGAIELAGSCAEAVDRIERHRARAHLCDILGRIHLGLNELDRARAEFTQELEVGLAGDRDMKADALRGLARTELADRRLDIAEAHALRALQVARSCGRVREGLALNVVAELDHARGRIEESIRHADQAVTIHRDTGHYVGLATGLRVLGEARLATGLDAEGTALITESEKMLERLRRPLPAR